MGPENRRKTMAKPLEHLESGTAHATISNENALTDHLLFSLNYLCCEVYRWPPANAIESPTLGVTSSVKPSKGAIDTNTARALSPFLPFSPNKKACKALDRVSADRVPYFDLDLYGHPDSCFFAVRIPKDLARDDPHAILLRPDPLS